MSGKICTKCGETKTLEMFGANKRTRDGLGWNCKACLAWQRRKSEEKQSEEWNSSHGIIFYISKRCWVCREVKALSEFRSDTRAKDGCGNCCKLCFLTRRQIRRETNKEKRDHLAMITRHRRRARMRLIGGSFTVRDIENILAIQNGRCCYCGRLGQSLQVEHIIPVTRKGSSNDPWNIALACRRCNSSKNDRLLAEWTDRWYERQTLKEPRGKRMKPKQK